MRTPLLMVEDDLDLGKSLKRQLESHDYDVLWVKSLSEFAQVNSQSVVAAIVDLNLPDGSGFTIIEKLKVPALIMTALNSPENRLRSAEEGVYDFIPKPFLFQELHIRLKRLLQNVSLTLSLGSTVIDFASRTVDNGQGDVIFLNDKEFQILKLLIEKTPQVMSREDILNTLKEPDSASHRTIDNVVVRLRQILNDENHNLIKSIRGVGYQWVGGKNE